MRRIGLVAAIVIVAGLTAGQAFGAQLFFTVGPVADPVNDVLTIGTVPSLGCRNRRDHTRRSAIDFDFVQFSQA